MDTTDYTKNNLGWFSIDTIPVGGEQVYIRGRIITDDQGGNFYKSLVIQEMVNGEQQTLRISVDASSSGGRYQLGQEIMIHIEYTERDNERINMLIRYAGNDEDPLAVADELSHPLIINACKEIGYEYVNGVCNIRVAI